MKQRSRKGPVLRLEKARQDGHFIAKRAGMKSSSVRSVAKVRNLAPAISQNLTFVKFGARPILN
jgi:hypothetical protein